MPKEAKRAPPAPVWNQSFPSPKALFVRGTFFIRCYPLVHSRGRSPIRNLGMRVAAVVPQQLLPLPLTSFNLNYSDTRKSVIECHISCGSFTVESESIGMGNIHTAHAGTMHACTTEVTVPLGLQ